jgi:hypothetical protein
MARVDVFHEGYWVGRGRRRYLTIVEKNERRCLQEGRGWERRVGAGGKGRRVVGRLGREVGVVL